MVNHTIQNTLRGELDAAADEQHEAWGTPLPLAQEHALPPFPVWALPTWLGAYVQGIAISTQTPADMAGAMGLAILSTALGRKAVVHPYPDQLDWKEPVNLYVLVVAEPGERKSAVLSHLSEPIREIEQIAQEAAKPEIERAEVQAKVLERRKAALIDAVAKGKEPGAQAELDEVAEQIAAHTVPATPRYVVGDITTEQLENLLAAQGGRLAMLSAEGGVFEVMAGRYTGGVPNLDAYLKAHAGDDLVVDRSYRTARVRMPALTAGLMVQPAVLSGLMAKPTLHGTGFLARWLYVLPTSLVGTRLARTPSVAPQVRAAYHAGVKALMGLEPAYTRDGSAVPHTIVCSNGAADLFERHQNHFERELGRGGGAEHIRSWGAKWTGAVARIAALLHLADTRSVGSGPIPLPTAERAFALGAYFLAHASAAFDAMGANPEIEAAKRVLQWVRDTRADTFTKRQVFNSIRRSSIFPTANTLDAPLALLEAHGYVRPLDEGKRTVGRPSATWLVNPNIADIADIARGVAAVEEPSSKAAEVGSGNIADIADIAQGVDEGEGEGAEGEDYVKLPSENLSRDLSAISAISAKSIDELAERAFANGYAVVVNRTDTPRKGSLAQRAAMAKRYAYVGREHTRFIKGEPVGSVSDRWGNPWHVGRGVHTRNAVILNYVRWLNGRSDTATQQGANGRLRTIADGTNLRIEAREELRGHALACHCTPEPCHAHILAAFANGYEVGVAEDGERLELWAAQGEGQWVLWDAAELYAAMLADICNQLDRTAEVSE